MNAGSQPGKMSGAYESPVARIEIRGTPAAKFVNILKLLTNALSLFILYETFGIDEENNNMQSELGDSARKNVRSLRKPGHSY
jgi:hypothetical protein